MDHHLDVLLARYTQTMPADRPSDTEALLGYLRDEGCSVIESIKALMTYHQLSLGEAKERVHMSATWADMRKGHDQFHQHLEDVARELSTQTHHHR